MVLFKDERTGEILKKYDQIDSDLLLSQMRSGSWREVIDELFDATMENPQMYNLKLLSAFAHWGLEEYEAGKSGGKKGGSSLGGWSI